MKKKTTDEIISDFNKIHGKKYDYSNVKYDGAHKKVCIVCPVHGEFCQTPSSHLQGCGCPKCRDDYNRKRFIGSLDNFILKSSKIHVNKYNYSKSVYNGSFSKLCIICPEHGEFYQTPHNHLNGNGCPKCAIEKSKSEKTSDKEEFIKKAIAIHGNKFIYGNFEYNGANRKSCIICPKHGEFYQTPSKHISGCGCPKCNGGVQITIDDFLVKAIRKHNGRYGYDNFEYVNNRTKGLITCPIHGDFLQSPSNHLKGEGCPKCNSSKMETDIRNYLISRKIEFEEQKRFKWLGRQSLDFYLPKYDIGIECQGIQHFEIVDYFGGLNELKNIKERDERKYNLCLDNSIKLLYYINESHKKYLNNKKLYITDIEDLKNIL